MSLVFILIMIIAILIGVNKIKSNILIRDRKWIDYIPKDLRKRRIK